MLKIYHSSMARSVRVIWAAEEMGIPYEVEKLDFKPEILQSEEYRAIHPGARVPAIKDDELVMFESGAIIEYLMGSRSKTDLRVEPGEDGYAAYLQWYHYAEATLLPPLSDLAQHSMIRPEEKRIAAVVPDAAARAADALALVEDALAGQDYLAAGRFTAADIMMGYSLILAKLFGLITDDTPNLNAYVARLEEREALQKTLSY